MGGPTERCSSGRWAVRLLCGTGAENVWTTSMTHAVGCLTASVAGVAAGESMWRPSPAESAGSVSPQDGGDAHRQHRHTLVIKPDRGVYVQQWGQCRFIRVPSRGFSVSLTGASPQRPRIEITVESRCNCVERRIGGIASASVSGHKVERFGRGQPHTPDFRPGLSVDSTAPAQYSYNLRCSQQGVIFGRLNGPTAGWRCHCTARGGLFGGWPCAL